MADSLYLSLWFPHFEMEDFAARVTSVLRQFPYSTTVPGIHYVAVQPISWSEPSTFERRFVPSATPEEAVDTVQEMMHDDFAVTFEAYWDLWTPEENASSSQPWTQRPSKVQIIAHGKEFEEAIYTEDGHLMIDFGLDTPFLHEELELDPATEQRVKLNIAKLVELTQSIEKNVNLSGRVLWSESEENLAQKLITRLQQVQ